MGQKHDFTCVIEDRARKEKFSAKVSVVKKEPIRKSLQAGAIDLADIFITPISGQEIKGSHNHFVVHDAAGHGLYIVRDEHKRDIERRKASIFDLGSAFGLKVRGILREFA